jgi:arylsulfatase A-like enzyme
MTKSSINRRDFLKLAATASLAPLLRVIPMQASAQAALQRNSLDQSQERPNIIIILFDALCAFNLSVYDYARRTSPNLERFAALSTVYHNHHSAGNFTTPSTGSLFTSTYPWTHRAFNLSSLISPSVRPHNLFERLHSTYNQVAFAQNIYADTLLYQFEQYLNSHQPLDSFSLAGHTFYNHLTPNDAIYGMKGLDQLLFIREEAHGSLVLSILNDLGTQLDSGSQAKQLAQLYPVELPRLANTDVYFSLDQVTEGVMGILDTVKNPSFVYLHFMPPHAPYVPAKPYMNLFDDGWAPPAKKKHRLASGVSEQRLNELRREYDQFVANLDVEFGRLLDHLESSGLLKNSYVIFTSDHGEIFERGAHGHSMPLVFEANIRIPLLIHAPGQRQRQDVQALTSNVDILPSLLAIAGLPAPEWAAGKALPGLGGEETAERSIYVVEAKANPAYQPLHKATVALIKGRYKLIHYLGYRDYADKYELYDLQDDPEELKNLYSPAPLAQDLRAELDNQLAQADAPYTPK